MHLVGKKSSRACCEVALQENTEILLEQQAEDAIRWLKLTSYLGNLMYVGMKLLPQREQ